MQCLKKITIDITRERNNCIGKILVNKIRCKKCGDIIESKSVHDFKFCKCEAVAVDGGHDYLRRVGALEDWEDLSVCETIEDNNTQILETGTEVNFIEIADYINENKNENNQLEKLYKYFDRGDDDVLLVGIKMNRENKVGK